MRDRGATTNIAIIGAGFGGLAMAVRLLQKGERDFLILEKASGLGGTWHDNTYPGCACDIPSHLYSFSFAQNPAWTRRYASQPEILAYLRRVAAEHGLEQKIRFNTEITSLAWSDDDTRWQITAADGRSFAASAVVLGVGGLHVPRIPEIPGLDRFTGPAFHSARWRHDVDLSGQRVAVIGSGASAIQIVPAIAPSVEKLVVFQRTPPWILPRKDRPISRWAAWACRHVPLWQRAWRCCVYVRQEAIAIAYTRWPKLLGHWEQQARQLMLDQIEDPQMRHQLWPHYTLGCKRALLSDDYYPALARENVELISERIVEIRGDQIVTSTGAVREVDVIILATGFRTFNPATEIAITGRDGRRLADDWKDGPEAYNGVLVAGYPNLFMLMGPNSGLGHNSIVFMIEAQVRYVLSCLALLAHRRLPAIEVRADVQRAFNEGLRRRFLQTVWVSDGGPWRRACTSWYKTAKGRLTALWPGFSLSYWWRLRRADLRDFLAPSPHGPHAVSPEEAAGEVSRPCA